MFDENEKPEKLLQEWPESKKATVHKLARSPEWKAALDAFLTEKFEPGDIIDKKWFYQAMDIEFPHPEMTLGKARRLELKFLEQFTMLCQELLASRKIALQTIGKQRYRIVPPEEQASWAETEGYKQVSKAIKKAVTRIVHTNPSTLSSDQQRERRDKLARMTMIADAAKKSRKAFLPGMKEDDLLE